ncbi:MAG: RnfABCDGE type electron transport complex subunit G [Deltaproteobacteria bacterium]|nr:RnfABCDGE type electron transport complex subunit G [Deltaproteobacteria bacterium]
MRELINMVVVLTGISLASGGLLASLRASTQERIDQQVLEFVKGPSVRGVFKDATNDPIATRFQLKDGQIVRTFFVGELEGSPRGVALEAAGKGYKGEVGLVVAVDTQTGKVIGIEVTTHSETPGLGAKAKTDPAFAAQFKGASVSSPAKVTQDGGSINAISGATITSRAVAGGVSNAFTIYERLKPQIEQKLKELRK